MLIYMQGDHTKTEISAVLEPYRSWLTTHRRPMTVKNRVYYAQRMLTWATESARNPWEISVEDLTEWILTVGSSPSTRKNAADGLRSLYRWAVATGRTNHNPTHDLPKITVPVLFFRSAEDHVVDISSSRALNAGLSSKDFEERVLEHSYHVATLDNDAPRIFAESAEFIDRVAGEQG